MLKSLKLLVNLLGTVWRALMMIMFIQNYDYHGGTLAIFNLSSASIFMTHGYKDL